jgi:hypothetical protein
LRIYVENRRNSSAENSKIKWQVLKEPRKDVGGSVLLVMASCKAVNSIILDQRTGAMGSFGGSSILDGLDLKAEMRSLSISRSWWRGITLGSRRNGVIGVK